MKQTLVLSDVHLSQAHPEDPRDPLWMRYRRREHHPDEDFAALVDWMLARAEAPQMGVGTAGITNVGIPETQTNIELVFNGDLFDFDSPWVKDNTSSFDEFPPTEEGCAEQVRLIMADHVVFFRAVAKLLARGHEVTFLSGNHDIELYWPGVRRAIRRELSRLRSSLPSDSRARGPLESHGEASEETIDLEQRVRFRSWFHISTDRIYFEHGSQYDIHNAVRHAAIPLTKSKHRIHPVLGKLAFRRTGARMGYFNPYYEETFYMGLFGYLGHFASFYARSHRHIVRTWFWGAMSTVVEIWSHRHDDERIEEGRAAVRAELGSHISDEAIDQTHALRARLAEDTMIPILRELWVDRVAMAFGCALLALGTLIFVGAKAAAIAIAIEILLFVVYELVTPKPDIRTYDSAPPSVLSLFDIHPIRAICMGHTHRPFTRFTDKGLYANSGSWCPAFEDQECNRPVLDGRPVLWLSTDEESLQGGLYWWRDGALVPDPHGTRPISLPPPRVKPGPKPLVQLDDSP